MLHCSRHPAISVYTTRTFGIIAFKYFQVLVFYSPIIIGFAVCFSVLFTKYADSYNELDDEEKLWPSIAMSLLKMLTMMAGDIESDGLFVEFRRLSSYYSRVVAFTMFTLFFFFVSLVFINLLNAYAVANVQKIESMAETSNQINRIETVLFFERFIQTTLKALGRFGRRKWKKTFIVDKDSAIKWTEVSATVDGVGEATSKRIWHMFQHATTQAVSQATVLRAKEKLLIDGFETKLNNINRTTSCAPETNTSRTHNNDTTKVDKRIRLLEAKIDNLCRILAKMNK